MNFNKSSFVGFLWKSMLILGIFIFASDGVNSQTPTHFEKIVGDDLPNYYNVIKQKGEYLYAAGFTGAANSLDSRAVFSQFDLSGNLNWTAQIHSPSSFNDFVETDDDEHQFLLVGKSEPINVNGAWQDNMSIMCSIDANGNILWINHFQQVGRENMNNIVRSPNPLDPDFPIYISGVENRSQNAPSSLDYVFVMNVNANGSIKWKNQYEVASDNEFVRDLVPLVNGNLALFGNYASPTGYGLIIDGNGGVSTDFRINPSYIIRGAIEISGTNEFYIVGEIQNQQQAFIARIDNQGNETWSYVMGTQVRFNQIQQASTGDLYVIGQGEAAGQDRFMVNKFSDMGQYQWTRYIENGESDYEKGKLDILEEGFLAYSDSRMVHPNGFGDFDAFIGVYDLEFNSDCRDEFTESVVDSFVIVNNTVNTMVESHMVNPMVISEGGLIDWNCNEGCLQPCVITCPDDITIPNDPGLCSAVVEDVGQPVLNGDCTDWSLISAPVTINPFPVGCTTLTWIFESASTGLQQTCSMQLCVEDTEAPVINCPDDITVDCLVNYIDPDITGGYATATDNCEVENISFQDFLSSNNPCHIIVNRVWTATDDSGNSSTCTQVIHVVDDTAPVISFCPDDITFTGSVDPSGQCITIIDLPVPIATDDCNNLEWSYMLSGATIGSGNLSNAFAAVNQGITTVTWTVEDICGNASSCSYTINFICLLDACPNCENNLVLNGDFQQGGFVNWTANTASPQVIQNDHCDNPVSMQMWGNRDVGESIIQTGVGFEMGSTYRISFCGRFVPQSTTTTPYVQFGFTASNGVVNPFTSPIAYNIGRTSSGAGTDSVFVNETAWNCYTLSDWTATQDFDDLIINVFNSIPDAQGGGSIVSWGRIDKICIVEVPSIGDCEIVCPDDITVPNDPGLCSAVVEDVGQPVLNGDCTDWSLISAPVTTNPFPVGCTTLTWIFESASTGLQQTCSIQLCVEDVQAPDVLCLGLSVDVGNGPVTISASAIGSATDNCQVVSENIDISSFDCSDLNAPVQVTYTATDGAGNSAQCVADVIANDLIPPVINCPDDVTIDCNVDFNDPDNTGGYAVATDICDTHVNITYVDNATIGNPCDIVINRVWTATDDSGNSSTCTQVIHVVDNTAPVLTNCPDDVIEVIIADDQLTCSADIMLPLPIVSDDCNNYVLTDNINGTGDASGIYNEGTTTVVWTATDECGNSSTCSIDVTVACVDTFECLANSKFYQTLHGNEFVVYNSLSANFTTLHVNPFEINAIGYNIKDNLIYGIVSGTKNLAVVGADGVFHDLGPVPGLAPPTGTGYYTGDFDRDGNLYVTRADINSVFKIEVGAYAINPVATEIQIPNLLPVADFAYIPGTPGLFYGLDVDGNLYSFQDNLNNTGTVINLGILTPDIPCTDSSGNPSGYGAAFSDINGNLYYFCNGSGDLFKVDLSGSTLTSVFLQGTGEVLSVNDGAACPLSNGLPMDCEIVCPDDITVPNDPGLCSAVVEDVGQPVLNGDCTDWSLISAPVTTNPFPVGCTTLTWEFESTSTGFQQTCSMQLCVEDTEAPVINCPDDITVDCLVDYNDPDITGGYATATDNCEVVNISFQDSLSSNSPCLSIINRVWTATDESGNSSTCTQIIHVVDNTAPVLTNCPDDVIEVIVMNDDSICMQKVSLPIPIVSDDCNNYELTNNINGTSDASGIYNEGTTTVVWTATDDCGNSSTCSIDVTVACVDTFECQDTSVFYQTLHGNEFVVYDSLSANFTTLHVNPFEINAIGYNIKDNLIYGIVSGTNNLAVVGADGVFHDLGPVQGLAPPIGTGYYTGDFDRDGNLYVTRGDINSVFKIDVGAYALNPVATEIQISNLLPVADFTFIPGTPGLFYGLDVDGNLYSFEDNFNNTGTVINLGILTPDIPCIDSSGNPSGYGAAFSDVHGNLYYFCNGSGDLYKVILGNSTQTSVLLHGTGEVLNVNDGTACLLPFVTSTEDNWKLPHHEINLYPNPTAGNLLIDLSTPATDNYDYRVVDLLGRTLRQGIIKQGMTIHTLEMNNFADGIYIIEIGDNETGFYRERIVKQTP